MPALNTPTTPLLNYTPPTQCDIDHAWANPTGQAIVLSVNCEDHSTVILYQPYVQPRSLAQGYFLDWSWDGRWFLFRDVNQDQIWLVSTEEDKQIPVGLPASTHHATLSPNGQHIVYARSLGLGWGSELGIFHLQDQTTTVWQTYPNQIVVYPRFSPDGQLLAYLLVPDNNVPFTVGELWVADPVHQTFTLLDNQADAGHGFAPVWKPHSGLISYVRRESSTPPQANQQAELLHSNIYLADPLTSKITPLTQFPATKVYDIVWSPNGHRLAFTAHDRVWSLVPGHPPTPISPSPTIARHPLWLNLQP